MRTLAVIALGLCVGLTGCVYRTTYRNLGTPGLPASASSGTATPHEWSWQHFFVYGLFPREILIPADDICKASGGVQEINTRRNLFQFLIWGVPLFLFGVDLYSPWDEQVVCADDSRSAMH